METRTRGSRQGLDWSAGLRGALCLYAFVQPLSISGANIAWGLVAVFLIGRLVSEGRRPTLPPARLQALFWVFMGVGLLTALSGVLPSNSLPMLHKDLNKVWLFYLFFAAFTLEPAPRAFRWLMAGAALSACIGILQVSTYHASEAVTKWFQGFGPGGFWKFLVPNNRAHGTIHAVTYGESMAFVLSGGVILLTLDEYRRELKLAKRTVVAWAVLIAVALVLSRTRGAWIGFVAAAVALARLRPRAVKALAGIGLGAAIVIALMSLVFPLDILSRFASIVDTTNNSNHGRIELWTVALQMFRDHPLLGVGNNNYRTLFDAYHPEMVLWEHSWGSAHNIYLHYLAERGLVGLASLLALFAAVFQALLARHKRGMNFWTVWALIATLGFFTMNLTESAWGDAMTWMPMIFLWAWTLTSPLSERPPKA